MLRRTNTQVSHSNMIRTWSTLSPMRGFGMPWAQLVKVPPILGLTISSHIAAMRTFQQLPTENVKAKAPDVTRSQMVGIALLAMAAVAVIVVAAIPATAVAPVMCGYRGHVVHCIDNPRNNPDALKDYPDGVLYVKLTIGPNP